MVLKNLINSILGVKAGNAPEKSNQNLSETKVSSEEGCNADSQEKETMNSTDNDVHGSAAASEKPREDAQAKSGKVQVFNLIIVDESGSMSGLRDVTLSGINETINTIREAQKNYSDVQEHYLTLVTFDERNDSRIPSVRTLIDARSINDVGDFNDYRPQGCTPLYDAMGQSLTSLKSKISGKEDAIGVVTVLTDGLENASRQWNAGALRRLIEQLKEEGWTFSYMGSAHDVKEVTDLLSIDNVVEFDHDMTGACNTWGRERSSKKAFYSRMAREYDADECWEDKKARRRRYNKEYYGQRVTPDNICSLVPNEVFVFGSNAEGVHSGGASLFAVRMFGARMGQGEGLQGQSYAIPTTEGMDATAEAVHRFCVYAAEHPESHFLVTQIGCGNAGHCPAQIAPMFKEAIELENVSLPQEFWEVLGLRMYNL